MTFPRMLSVAFALCLTISSLVAQNTDAALDRFRKEMASLDARSKKTETALKDNPLAGLLVFRSMIAGVKTIRTEGLPADLKAAFNDTVATMEEAGRVFDGWPEKPEEIPAYLHQRMGQDPTYQETFRKQMAAMNKKLERATRKMDEMGKKYNFDNVGSGAEAPM